MEKDVLGVRIYFFQELLVWRGGTWWGSGIQKVWEFHRGSTKEDVEGVCFIPLE